MKKMKKAFAIFLLQWCSCTADVPEEEIATKEGVVEIGEKSQAVWYIPFPCQTPADGLDCGTPRDSLTETRFEPRGDRIYTWPGSGAYGAHQDFYIEPIQSNRFLYVSWNIDSTNRCFAEHCVLRICLYPSSICKTTYAKTGTTGVFMDQPIQDGQPFMFRVFFESRLDQHNSFSARLTMTHDAVW